MQLYFIILYSRLLFHRIKEVLKRENEERQRELRDLEAFVKKENAERKAAEDQIQGVLNAENEKRMKEAAALKEKMEREKKEMQVHYSIVISPFLVRYYSTSYQTYLKSGYFVLYFSGLSRAGCQGDEGQNGHRE